MKAKMNKTRALGKTMTLLCQVSLMTQASLSPPAFYPPLSLSSPPWLLVAVRCLSMSSRVCGCGQHWCARHGQSGQPAEYLVELRNQPSLAVTNQQVNSIVALWQNLPDYNKQRVVFSARHGEVQIPQEEAGVHTWGGECEEACTHHCCPTCPVARLLSPD